MSDIDDFYKRISKNRLFILGAGFSAGAGIPMIGTLLAEAMRLFEKESNGMFRRINNYAKVCFQKDYIDFSAVDFSHFSTFLEYIELREFGGGERWSDRGSREKLTFKYYLSKAIVSKTPQLADIPELYLEFAREVHSHDIVITFNWDVLLEKALLKVGKTYRYCNFENIEADIIINKLHGSVNWRLEQPLFHKQIMKWNSLEFTTGIMNKEMYYCNSLLEVAAWDKFKPFTEVDPFIVLPGYGKAYDVRHIAPLWYKPETAFEFAKDVYIIGFRLAEDDYFVNSLLLHNLPYVDDSRENFKRTIHIKHV